MRLRKLAKGSSRELELPRKPSVGCLFWFFFEPCAHWGPNPSYGEPDDRDNEYAEGSFLVDFLVFYRVWAWVGIGAHLDCPGRSFWVARELILGPE